MQTRDDGVECGSVASTARDDAAVACDIYVDTTAPSPPPPPPLSSSFAASSPRRCGRGDVSISSVDSEPIAPLRSHGARQSRHRQQRQRRRLDDVAHNGNDDDDDDADKRPNASDDDDYDDGGSEGDCVSACSSSSRCCSVAESDASGAARATTRRRRLCPLDETAAEATAIAAGLSPDARVAASHVSEAFVATVTTVAARGATLIAESAEDGLVVDSGTLLCTSDGRVVGVVAALIGPVHRALYVVACVRAATTHTTAAASSSSTSTVTERATAESPADTAVVVATAAPPPPGTRLHTDVTQQRVIVDVVAQCDVARGTDASYVNDEELPPHVRPDFSDDEAEVRWKREQRRRGGVAAFSISSDDDDDDDDATNAHVDVDWESIAWDEATATPRVPPPQSSVDTDGRHHNTNDCNGHTARLPDTSGADDNATTTQPACVPGVRNDRVTLPPTARLREPAWLT